MAKQAQEEYQRREECMSHILEHVVSQQEPSHHSTTTTNGATSSSAPWQTKFPFGAAPDLHLSSSASLLEFDACSTSLRGT
ncbi:hypothetical protein Hamer_G018914 [Homarus americanus]|uniref:Uncharacterized protein n=1 Tax=Homarus americanus TaxID=6706 RepID=A0A8J5N5Q1_HOMAM|nr:hypothetical protein Hamer_G018914 [Homarus americanus]